MAGKKKTSRSTNLGGSRPGAGRPKAIKSLSEAQVKAMLKEAKAYAKAAGKTLDKVLLEIAYEDKATTNRLAAIRLFKEFTMSRVTEQHRTVTEHKAPVIGLPPIRQANEAGVVTPLKREASG